jgi:proteasomal ATPase-associated factor 1
LSGSKDGSIKLWDVSQGVCLTSLYAEGFAGVEKIATGKHAMSLREIVATSSDPNSSDAFTPKPLEGEVSSDTDDRLLFAGLSSSAGTLSLYDLTSKQPILRSFPHIPSDLLASPTYPSTAKGGAIHSVAYDPERYLLASGSAKGIIVIRDVRMLDKDGGGALHVLRRTEAPMNDLAFVQPSSTSSLVDLVIAPESGLPCRLGIPLDGGHPMTCVEEYAGWDPVSIESIAVGGQGQVWVSGAEGGIRSY